MSDAMVQVPSVHKTPALDQPGDSQLAWDTEGEPREGADVTELTGLYRTGTKGDQLKGWPGNMRALARRERPHPGAQLPLFEQPAGYRFPLTATTMAGRQPQFLEACHRVQARAEDRIRCAIDTGLRRLPSHSCAIHSAWCVPAALACDLLACLALLGLDGDLAKAEPKTMRYTLLHTAGRIVHGQRRRRLRIPENWPWAEALRTAFARILAHPSGPGFPRARTPKLRLKTVSEKIGTIYDLGMKSRGKRGCARQRRHYDRGTAHSSQCFPAGR